MWTMLRGDARIRPPLVRAWRFVPDRLIDQITECYGWFERSNRDACHSSHAVPKVSSRPVGSYPAEQGGVAMGLQPTVSDVAGVAGVSRQTVSNVLNAPELVRPETRERVTEAIRTLGYRPHASARRL